ncbi:MAG: DUF1571 domain-containing protein [Archangium sp.]|nr:DUF1571 domain-containing protein [Archangium sp.]
MWQLCFVGMVLAQVDGGSGSGDIGDVLKRAQQAVVALGTYRYHMVSQERVGGTLLPENEVDLFVRETPFAVRLEYVGGPAKGRFIIYDPAVRADEFRVRESGLLRVTGAWWVPVDSPLAKRTSNHSVREAGLGRLLDRLARNHVMAAPLGGFAMSAPKTDAQGHRCADFRAPEGKVHFDYRVTHLCSDPVTGLVTRVEGYDDAGALLERFAFTDIQRATLSDDFLHPVRAKL